MSAKVQVTNSFQTATGSSLPHTTKDPWDHETQALYVTDETGAVWEIRPGRGGLLVRACGDEKGRDTIFIKPEVANSILLQTRSYDSAPKKADNQDLPRNPVMTPA